MSLGPIEIFVVGFPENEFTGEIAPALADLVGSRDDPRRRPRVHRQGRRRRGRLVRGQRARRRHLRCLQHARRPRSTASSAKRTSRTSPKTSSRARRSRSWWSSTCGRSRSPTPSAESPAASVLGSIADPARRRRRTHQPDHVPIRSDQKERTRRCFDERWTGAGRGDDRGGGGYRRRRPSPSGEQVRRQGSAAYEEQMAEQQAQAPAPAPAARASPRGGRRRPCLADQNLANLKAQGVLSEEEFAAAKAKLISG